MALDVLQSSTSYLAQLSSSVIILYHWLRLHKFPSPTLYFLNTLLNIMGRRFTEPYKAHELFMNTHTVVGRRRRY